MTLSWGGHPAPPLPPVRKRHIWRWILGALVLVIAALVGLAYVGANTTAGEARLALLNILTRQRAALSAHDLDGYLETFDPTRVSLRTCAQQRFETAVLQNFPVPSLALGKTDTYRGYVRAFVADLYGWKHIFVRKDNVGRWYVTEPTTGDLGDTVTRDYAGISVSSNEAESDLLDAVGAGLDGVRSAVLQYAPAPPTQFFTVRVATLAATNGQCFISGTAAPGYGGTRITMRDVYLGSTLTTLSTTSRSTLMHEALHWIQFEHSADAMNAMDWWLVEGWPYHIADDPSGPGRERAVCAGPLPTYFDMRRGPSAGTSAVDVTRDYVIASLLIERLETQYGRNTYWRVVDSFAQNIDATRSFAAAIGTTGETFYDAWSTDARSHYC